MKRLATALLLIPLVVWLILAAPVWALMSRRNDHAGEDCSSAA